MNVDAARYAIDLAKALELLADNCVWLDHGLLLRAITTDSIDLNSAEDLSNIEKLYFFRLFLEKDGAALLFLLKKAVESHSLQAASNELAAEMVRSVYSGYLEFAGGYATRVELRSEIRRLEKGYNGRTGAHKLFVHLQTLYRLGLLDRMAGRNRIYTLPASEHSVEIIQRFTKRFRDYGQLEQALNSTPVTDIVLELMGLASTPTDEISDDVILTLVMQQAHNMLQYSPRLCPIQPLIESVQLLQASAGRGLSFARVSAILSAAQRAAPREIRFYVDRQGRPAYVRLLSIKESQAVAPEA